MNFIIQTLLFLIGIPAAVILLSEWYHITARECALVYFLLMLILLMATADRRAS